jgi:hypothetical protein
MGTQGDPERREKPRIEERCRVAFRLIREGEADTKAHAGETLNLSESGLCLVAPFQLEQDADVALELSLTGHAQPVLAMGRVVWCDREGPTYRVGISFAWMRDEDREALSTLSSFIQARLG